MQKNVLQIIWVSLLLGFVSMVYFLLLIVHVPFIVTLLLAVAAGYFGYRSLNKNISTVDAPLGKSYVVWSYVILIVGVFLVTNKGYYLEQKYGYWDAWWIWNYHARFLQSSEYWKQLFSMSSESHPDYPLYLPSVIAFLRRLTGTDNAIVPFTFSYFITLMIPVGIYLSLYRKNLPIAALVFFLLVTDEFYIDRGFAQYADLPLGFLFLCAFICLEVSERQAAIVAVIGALLGCCMWMKNEGIMLSAFFILFNARTLFAQGRWKYFIAGIALPVLTLVIFKNLAPATDLIEGQNAKTGGYLSDASRYKLVWQYLGDNFNHNFIPIKIGLIIYTVFCFVERKLPGRNMLILLCCLAGYFFVYIMTPKSLEWHLQTSMDRVLMQLMPSFMYVLALRFCSLKISINDSH